MRKRLIPSIALAAFACLLSASTASADFGLKSQEVIFTNADGSIATQAGSHPFAQTTALELNTKTVPGLGVVSEEYIKDGIANLPPGYVGDPNATPHCSNADFANVFTGPSDEPETSCPLNSVVGVFELHLDGELVGNRSPIYNLDPPPGQALRLGFRFVGVSVMIEATLSDNDTGQIRAAVNSASQAVPVTGSKFTIWGNPADPRHDDERGLCLALPEEDCSVNIPEKPFITMPRSCTGPLLTVFEVDSWEHPGQWVEGIAESAATTGCSKLPFSPTIEVDPTTSQAETGTGLDVSVEFDDEGLGKPNGIAQSDVRKARLTLPPGMTINPSVGEGLDVCTPAQLKRETVNSAPGAGCPDASKIGTLHVETPIIDEPVDGSIFLAQQDDPSTSTPGAENPFDSLIAGYFVLRNANLGVILKLPVKVEPDSLTGQLSITLDDVPQLPFSKFEAHLRTGARAALITPPTCGTYSAVAEFTPWADPSRPLTTTSTMHVNSGVGAKSCPSGGLPPFHPDFEAGSMNNNAGSFSPFDMRLIRSDGEQDMTKFSAILPPGELGSLAGVDKCPDSAISIAKAKTARQEIASPSCPANSLIGHTLAGAGVGEALTYVGGKIYLGGPYKGDPLSVIAVTPALAGPFDAGTVVVRLALTLNPKTAEVEVDGANSDPIPHILKGIVLKVRDLRVYVDRPNFTLNPTSCDESKARSVLFGSYLNVLDPADDKPVDLSTRYQAANCQNLGFKPDLRLNLKGGSKRGGHPALKAIYTPKKGDANIKGLVVRLPRSAFLDQAHIKTICTRVQFAAKACPERARYGYIKAWTPLLDTPLEGPVYLRSSSHKLPDLVFDLHGLVDIEVAVRIDSAKGGIRATLEDAPDAPLSKVELRMQGAKKGLIINSRDLCGSVNRANVEFTGQNGKQFKANPEMKPDCGGGRKRERHF